MPFLLPWWLILSLRLFPPLPLHCASLDFWTWMGIKDSRGRGSEGLQWTINFAQASCVPTYTEKVPRGVTGRTFKKSFLFHTNFFLASFTRTVRMLHSPLFLFLTRNDSALFETIPALKSRLIPPPLPLPSSRRAIFFLGGKLYIQIGTPFGLLLLLLLLLLSSLLNDSPSPLLPAPGQFIKPFRLSKNWANRSICNVVKKHFKKCFQVGRDDRVANVCVGGGGGRGGRCKQFDCGTVLGAILFPPARTQLRLFGGKEEQENKFHILI